MADFDLAIIGGGIAGAGLARDAAGRGLSVLLAEQNDLGSGASSASKLIDADMRRVTLGALGRTREMLAERQILLAIAPHLVRPMRIVVPVGDARPAWRWRADLLARDWLGGAKNLAGAEALDLSLGELAVPLKRGFRQGFAYSACRVDDSRLVVLNAVDAAERGATIRPRTRVVRADRDGRVWRLALTVRGSREAVTARVLVNAAGAWAPEVMERVVRLASPAARSVKTTHVVVRRLFEHDHAYLIEGRHGRRVWAMPYADDFTLIGAAEHAYVGHPGAAAATAEEITYLCRAASACFREPVDPAQVLCAFAGVRAVPGRRMSARVGPGGAVLALDAAFAKAPLLSLYGGSIATYRTLAEAALASLARHLALPPPWTGRVPLPGGDFPQSGTEALIRRACGLWGFLKPDEARRLVLAYGTRLDRMLGPADAGPGAGRRLAGALTAAEVRYLMAHEWAQTPEDVLWRRTKLGLRLDAEAQAALAAFMTAAAEEGAAAE